MNTTIVTTITIIIVIITTITVVMDAAWLILNGLLFDSPPYQPSLFEQLVEYWDDVVVSRVSTSRIVLLSIAAELLFGQLSKRSAVLRSIRLLIIEIIAMLPYLLWFVACRYVLLPVLERVLEILQVLCTPISSLLCMVKTACDHLVRPAGNFETGDTAPTALPDWQSRQSFDPHKIYDLSHDAAWRKVPEPNIYKTMEAALLKARPIRKSPRQSIRREFTQHTIEESPRRRQQQYRPARFPATPSRFTSQVNLRASLSTVPTEDMEMQQVAACFSRLSLHDDTEIVPAQPRFELSPPKPGAGNEHRARTPGPARTRIARRAAKIRNGLEEVKRQRDQDTRSFQDRKCSRKSLLKHKILKRALLYVLTRKASFKRSQTAAVTPPAETLAPVTHMRPENAIDVSMCIEKARVAKTVRFAEEVESADQMIIERDYAPSNPPVATPDDQHVMQTVPDEASNSQAALDPALRLDWDNCPWRLRQGTHERLRLRRDKLKVFDAGEKLFDAQQVMQIASDEASQPQVTLGPTLRSNWNNCPWRLGQNTHERLRLRREKLFAIPEVNPLKTSSASSFSLLQQQILSGRPLGC